MVTCNATDDTALNDELSRRFASCCHTSKHGSHFLNNQNSNHQNHFVFSTSGAKLSASHDNPAHPIKNRFNYCTMLPPFENDCNHFESPQLNAPMDNYNHQMCPPSQLINASINHSTHQVAGQSFQTESSSSIHLVHSEVEIELVCNDRGKVDEASIYNLFSKNQKP